MSGPSRWDQPLIRTLVVEDDPLARQLHTTYVAAEPGFTVVAAVATGAEALNVVGNGAVDLVLLDIHLPGFSGIEVLHRLRTGSGPRVDVIVISSSRDRVTVRQALSGQVAGYLVKPFSRVALEHRLRAYRTEQVQRGAVNEDGFGQHEIDSLLGGRSPGGPRSPRPAGAAPGRLPKGLSQSTMDLVLATLGAGSSPRTAQEVAAACGASRATVRRYLEHLHSTGAVDVSHRYGRPGRPELLYRLAPPG